MGGQFSGANWVAHSWYARNLKIVVNLTRITELEDERILLIIGGGHLGFLRACLKSAVCRVRTAHQSLMAPEGIKRLMKERDRDLEGV